ncbi:hypothetical protein K7X08_024389 [Anisodus acutangulus]|uniref:Uncharacterized protein n=1 Tax=Anisodus acutangulus TaxID=402998 RepID=A0A9Q1M897_9SOLA|nr:hypothetical protein K7X08_024389 [Anisodus acutangulus]
MRKQLSMSWQQLCRLVMISKPSGKPLRDKTIAVAGRAAVKEEGMVFKASCPACLQVINTPHDSDVRMTMVEHISIEVCDHLI